jgi:hypothetical protein
MTNAAPKPTRGLKVLKTEFASPGTRLTAGELIISAETIMQAEHAAWLTEMVTVKS